jgi:hypothetical protein
MNLNKETLLIPQYNVCLTCSQIIVRGKNDINCMRRHGRGWWWANGLKDAVTNKQRHQQIIIVAETTCPFQLYNYYLATCMPIKLSSPCLSTLHSSRDPNIACTLVVSDRKIITADIRDELREETRKTIREPGIRCLTQSTNTSHSSVSKRFDTL